METFKTDKEGFIVSDVKLTIGLLVSNRIQHINNVLSALKPLLDEIPAELICVDTVGSEKSDGSAEVARKFTDQVYYFEWCNDFAKARNVCFEHAKGEWFMFLDDDEVFEDVREIVDFFKSGEYRKYSSAMYYINNILPNGKKNKNPILRMVRRKSETCFVGRVHESFNLAYEPCKIFEAFVNHYGYYLVTTEEVRAHQKRNITLLEEEIRENGLTEKMAAQLVQERIFTDGTEEEGYNSAVKFIEELTMEDLEMPAGQWILGAIVRYFFNMGDAEGAIYKAEEIKAKYRLSHITRLTVDYVAACSAASLEYVDKCILYAREYLAMYILLSQNPADAMLQIALDSNSFRDQEHYLKMIEFLMVAYCNKGMYNDALLYVKKYREECGELDGHRFGNVLRKILAGIEDKSVSEEFWKQIYTEEGMKLVFR